MKNEFASYKQAVALKELGFNEPCLRFYTKSDCSSILSLDADNGDTNSYLTTLHKNYVSAPLKQQVFRWFREKYGLFQGIEVFIDDDGKLFFDFKIMDHPDKPEEYYDNDLYSAYEEAENALINKLIELVKQDKNERTI